MHIFEGTDQIQQLAIARALSGSRIVARLHLGSFAYL